MQRALPLRGLVRIGCTRVLNTSKFRLDELAGALVEAAAELPVGAGNGTGAADVVLTRAASVTHSGSCCERQCLPPPCQWLPPASSASGFISSGLFVGTPGRTRRCIRSKLRRDCSSV